MAGIFTTPLLKLNELVGRVVPTEGDKAFKVFTFPSEAREINSAMGKAQSKSAGILPLAIVKEQWEGNPARVVSKGSCNQYETNMRVIVFLYRGFQENTWQPAKAESEAQSWIIPFYNELQTDRSLGGSVLRVGYENSDTYFEERKGQIEWDSHIMWGVVFDLPIVISI